MRRFGVVAGALILVAGPAMAGGYRLLDLDGVRVKWGAPVLATGATVTYGLATAKASFPDALNCREMAPATQLGGAWSAGGLAAVAAQAFGLWQRAADIDLRPALPGETPDILIGAQGEPDHIAFADVWPDRGGAVAGIAPLARASICLNPELHWVADSAGPEEANLGTVLAHEIGHALGLDHPGPAGALMGYSDQGDIDALMPGDVAGAVALYGPPKD